MKGGNKNKKLHIIYMETLKNVLYASLGFAQQNTEEFKEKFEEFVKVGKTIDQNGKNYINDLFQTLEDSKGKLGENYNTQLEKVEKFIDSLKIKE